MPFDLPAIGPGLDKANRKTLADLPDSLLSLVGNVSYNPPAAKFMRTATSVPGLPGITVKPICPDTIQAADASFEKDKITGADRRIADFPRTAIVTKSAWTLVSRLSWRAMPVPVWRGMADNNNPRGPLESGLWRRPVLVDPRKARNRCSCTMIDCGAAANPPRIPADLATLPQVPIDGFFYLPVCDSADVDYLKRFFKLIDLQAGDYLVLMGLHLTTREIPNWTWSTFWWNSDPSNEFAQERPYLPLPWRNYVMDTTLDMEKPMVPRGSPKAIFNPWLELQSNLLAEPASSNCIDLPPLRRLPQAGHGPHLRPR